MKKNNLKIKQYGIVTVLVVICIVLAGLIYTTGQQKDDNQLSTETERQENEPIVGELEYDAEVDEPIEIEEIIEDEGIQVENIDTVEIEEANEEPDAVTVEPIEVDGGTGSDLEVIVEEKIEVTIVEEPEKPDLTPPEEQPETTDDLTDPDNVPGYEEDEVTYTPEPEPEEPEDEVRGSNLVPDSENPFLQENIPSNGEGGEIQGEDLYQDGVPAGEGDKF
jgi:hypothetical protein